MKTKLFLSLSLVLLSTILCAQRTTIYPTLTADLTINDQNSSGYEYYAVGAVVTTEPATYSPFPDIYNPLPTAGSSTFYANSGPGVPKPDPVSLDFYSIRILVIKVVAGTTTEVARRYGSSYAYLDTSDNLIANKGIEVNF